MEPRRLADIRAGDALRACSYGSGYLIAPRLVLTARHTVVDARTGSGHPRIDVRIGHTRVSPPIWRDGEICWAGQGEADVALVWLSAPVHLPGAEPVRWGRPTGRRAVPYEGLGYPLLAEYVDDERGVEQLRGILPPLSTGPADMFVLDQASAPRTRPDDGSRAWSGVSGAAVFCHDHLVGVVVRDDAEFENRRLHAYPSQAFVTETGFVSLLSGHGDGPPRVEDIPETDAGEGETLAARLLWPTSMDGAPDDGRPGAASRRPLPAPAGVHLPPAPTAFVGREDEVGQLLEFLRPDGRPESATTTALLSGMAGVGKTALALHVAHRAHQRGWFRGGVLFLNAHGYGPNRAAEAHDLTGRLLRAFGFGDLPGGPVDGLAAWHELLSALDHDGLPVLVVVDDVSAAGQVAALFPGESRHRLVLTSRNALTDLDARLVPLPLLTTRHSVALIDECLRIARPNDRRFAEQTQDTLRLTELCGGLPLALRTMASILRPEPTLSPADLADELADTRMRLDALSPDGIDMPVRAAFDLSYRRLTPDQARAFRSMSVHPGPYLSAPAVAALIDGSVPVARRALRSLSRVHLVENASAVAGATDGWSMHSLVRIYAQEQAENYPDESAACLTRLFEYYHRRSRAVSHALSGMRSAPPMDGLTNSADAMGWLNAERVNMIAVGIRAVSVGREDVALDVVLDQCEYMYHHDFGDEFLPLTEKVVEWTRGVDRTDVKVSALVAHSSALISAGRAQEAVAPLRSALGITRTVAGLEGVVRLALGMVYRSVDRLKEAVAQCRAAVALFDEVGELGKKSSALTSLGNALRLLDLPGQAAEAHRQAAEIAKTTGATAHHQAVCLNNLGNALSDMGQEEQSVAALRQAIELARECGALHMEITTLGNLGSKLRDSGRHAEAAEIWCRIAELCHDIRDSEREFMALSEAGRAFQKLDDFPAMLGITRQAVACSQRIENQVHAAQVMNNLAYCLEKTGDLAASVDVHVRSALHFLANPDPDEANAAENQITLALQTAREINDPGDAADVLLKAAALVGDAQQTHWEGQLRSTAGSRLADAERHEESVTVLRAAAETLESAGDRTRQGYALNNLGISLRALSRYEESAAAIRQDLAICRDAGDRAGEATSLLNLAETLSESGNTQNASALWREALDLLVAVEADQETIEEVRRKLGEVNGPRDRDADAATEPV